MRLKRRHFVLLYVLALLASRWWQDRHPPAETPAPVFPEGSAARPEMALETFDARAFGPALAGVARLRVAPASPEGPALLFASRTSAPAALRRAAEQPEAVRGLILLDPVGPEETTALGNRTLNRTLGLLWLGAVEIVQRGLPHFGALRDWPVPRARAARWLETEPLAREAGVMERVKQPVLILRTRSARLLLDDSVREVARLLPQSREVAVDARWNNLIRNPAALASPVSAFVGDVLTGRAVTRASAEPARRAAAGRPFGGREPLAGAMLALVVALLALCMQTSEDLTCVGAGLLASTGFIGVGWAMLGCGVGLVAGDTGLYLLGRFFGKPLLRMRPFRWMLTERAVERAARRYHERGFRIVFLSRFLPGMRVPMYVAAGILGVPLGRFVQYLTLAALAWTPLLVGLCWHFGKPMLAWIESHQAHAGWWTLALFLGLWWTVHTGLPLFTRRGRRLWVGAWTRRLRWEFWPRWAFYPPVALYLVWLMIRHRSLTLPTAANPGIPAGGGLVEESKSEILRALGSNGEWVARWTLLPLDMPLEQKLAACGAFGYPVVLKPDTGCRGSGVGIARDPGQARRYLSACPRDVIAQQYVPGVEYGIFYARKPGEERGRIISITEKRPTAVTGDGVTTLEMLILNEPRGAAMAPFFLAKFADELDRVPAADERVTIAPLGTHARGALFLNAADLLTPALEERIDAISRGLPGFHFGRYDIRGPSREAFRNGGPFQVLELNGLTAESTHIYDPSTPLWRGYAALFRQWRLAFEIGALNRDAGHRPLRLREIRALFKQHANTPEFESPV